LVRSGATTVLKARLDPTPAHPRALQWLLEAIALWQGTPVRAVLYVGGSGDEYGAPLLRDWFPDFGGPLYTIEWHDRAVRREHDDELTGLGEFDELEQLQLFDALETGR
jgi:hypothetical protein